MKPPYWNDDIVSRMIDKGFDGAEIHRFMTSMFDSIGEFSISFSVHPELTKYRDRVRREHEARLHIILDFTVPKNRD